MKKNIVFIVVIFCVLLLFFKFRKPVVHPVQKQTHYIMGTFCTIQVSGSKEVLGNINRAFARMNEVDKKFNVMDQESPLYEFNKRRVSVTDKEIVNLVKIAVYVSKKCEGAFDVTVYPLMRLWDFSGDSKKVPAKQAILKTIKNIGYNKLIIGNNGLSKQKKSVAVDLGGIAKGYAVKEAVKVLKEDGITSALVDAGGDIYALGTNYGKPWKIGIKDPRKEGIIEIVEVSDMAVFTSGDYEKFFDKDGVRYHHILDPRTGYPARGLASVTVIAHDAVLADAWSTAFFVMGKDAGMEFVENTPDMEALMITVEGDFYYSSGFKKGFTGRGDN